MTIYAVGDIHGHLDKLDEVLHRIDREGGAGAEVVFIGDYIDRGPDSRGVLDRLIDGQRAGRRWTCLSGNHDWMFARFLSDGTVDFDEVKSGKFWTHEVIGGLDTLRSYGVDADARRSPQALWQDAQDAVPSAHRAFLDQLPLYAERPGLLFVHAGIRPGVALSDQQQADLIWIRDDFLLHRAAFDWLVIHGHTAVDGAEHRGNRINVDGGAGFGRALRVIAIEDQAVFELTETGRRVLDPGDWGTPPR